MTKLKEKSCAVCEDKTVTPFTKEKSVRMLHELSGWTIAKNGKSIEKEIEFKNFDKAMDFVNMVADVAEFEGHHPDIHIWYNIVRLELYTHAIKGLSENDFILAAKIDAIVL